MAKYVREKAFKHKILALFSLFEENIFTKSDLNTQIDNRSDVKRFIDKLVKLGVVEVVKSPSGRVIGFKFIKDKIDQIKSELLHAKIS